MTTVGAAPSAHAARTVIRLLRHDATLVHYRVNTVILQDALRKRGYGVGSTGLMLAAERGHLATVRALLEHGANPPIGRPVAVTRTRRAASNTRSYMRV